MPKPETASTTEAKLNAAKAEHAGAGFEDAPIQKGESNMYVKHLVMAGAMA